MKGTIMSTLGQELAVIGEKSFKIDFLDNSDFIFRNFSGVEKQYNAAGDRNFCIRLDEKIANELAAMDIPVKILEPREEGMDPLRFIKVKVRNFSKIYVANVGQKWPESMSLAERKEKQRITEAAFYTLDVATIQNAAVILSVYHWRMNHKSGISLSLNEGYFKLIPNEMELNFFDIPDGESPMNTITFEQVKKKIED